MEVRDLAEWTILALENRDVGIFNAVGPEKPYTVGAMLAACKQASGSDATFTWAAAAFREDQKVSGGSDLPVWVPPAGEEGGLTRVSIAKAVERGLKFRPVVDTARDTLTWFNALPATP